MGSRMAEDKRALVLITGADSFTGRYVQRELEGAGFQVAGTVKQILPGSGGFQCDLTRLNETIAAVETARPSYVVHLAGVTHVAHADRSDFYRVNLLGTLNLLEALQRSGITPNKIILVSSANVYGNALVEPITESTPVDPVNDYAVSKLAMEQMARLWFERFPILIARPFNYTGVGQSTAFLLPKIVDHFRRRAPVIQLGNIDVARDFSDVRVVARCYAALLTSGLSGEIVNICSGRGTSIRQVLDAMEMITGHQLEVRTDPSLVRRNEIARLVGSPRKLAETLGTLPQIELPDTLRWMFAEPAPEAWGTPCG